MKRLVVAAAIAIAVTLSAGCYRTTILNGPAGGGVPSPIASARWYHGLILGLADLSGPIDLRVACPSGWSAIYVDTSIVDMILTSITAGIWTPQHVTVFCTGGFGAYQGDLQGTELSRIRSVDPS